MILSCFRCRDNVGPGAKFQDKRYGKGRRVYNATDKTYRCTICENERSPGDQKVSPWAAPNA